MSTGISKNGGGLVGRSVEPNAVETLNPWNGVQPPLLIGECYEYCRYIEKYIK